MRIGIVSAIRRTLWRRAKAKWGFVLVLVLAFGPAVLDAGSLAWRKSVGCSVWMVTDGDTVRMTCPDRGAVSGRIIGYDTPEMKARCPRELGLALAATYALRWQIWTARELVATPRGTDRYGRTLVLMAADGQGVGRPLVEAGLARWYDGGRRRGWCGGETA